VLEIDGELVAYFSACPHRLGPLQADGDAGRLRCPWHGYAFDLRRRESCDGRGLRMRPGPRVRVEGPDEEVRLEWS
jgi:nitrite reductase/ring-hydroxylating ferredoxin subunit